MQGAASDASWIGTERSALKTLSRAVRDMPLDPEGVVRISLEALVDLGFPDSAVFAVEPDGGSPRRVAQRGDPFEPGPAVDAVIGSGAPIVMGRVIASPAWVDGWLVAIVVGRRERDREPRDSDVDAIGLLAAATGVGLQNAQRFELERQTVERLEQVDRLKSDFLTTVSHELRTPLTAIQGMGQTLERSWPDLDEATRTEFLGVINRRAAALAEMVAELVDVSDLDAAAGRLSTGVVNLTEVLEASLSWASAEAGDRIWLVEVAPDLLVVGDPKLLGRVVDQLLSNAFKHTPDGTTVTVRAAREVDSVVVSVADDGPGISPEDLPRIGERFHRGGSLNDRATGLGLGLSLAHDILALHGSRLEVTSEGGRGAHFSFALRTAG